jgi:MoxR-like ATPase
MTPDQTTWFAETFDALVANVCRAVLGTEHTVRLAVTAMLAEGHLLLEDAPGRAPTSASSSRRTCCRAT